MSSEFIYIRPSMLRRLARRGQYPDIDLFSGFGKLYGGWVLPIDRTGTIQTPARARLICPLPTFRSFTKSYEDICNDRAREILTQAEKRDVALYVLYSGGIDSTAVIVSLLKNASLSQKKRIVVLLSHESIIENPNFYEDHIKHNLRVDSSNLFPYLLGGTDMIVSGENNDQVMGSDKAGRLIARYGPEIIHKPYQRDLFTEFWGATFKDNSRATTFYVDVFEKLMHAAPVRISTNFEYLWWINFALKWQTVFAYTVLFTAPRNAHKITADYLYNRYLSFYNTDEFQLWSMNNLDKRIKDSWKTYKWVTKDLIYAFNRDAEYRDHKMKRGSRANITRQQLPYEALALDGTLVSNRDPIEYYNPDNSFVIP